MIKTHSEEIISDLEGTIIDLETIGYFDDRYEDSRRYRKIVPIIFGFINRGDSDIVCRRSRFDI